MKKIIVFFISASLLMYQFLYAQTTIYPPIEKKSNPVISKDRGKSGQLLFVNVKPANVADFATPKFASPYDTIPGPVKIASPSGVGTITTSVGITSTCLGSGFTIDYSSTNATFLNGNVFTAQLSDAAGSFVNPVTIGTLVSTAVLGMINVTIPPNTIPGSNYRIRVVSNDPVITGSSSSSIGIGSINTWTGSVSSAWENAANWSCGLVPNENSDVVINSGSVIVNSNAVCKTLNVSQGVNFTVNTGFVLTIIQ